MELIVIYMTGMILLMGAWACRVPHEDCRIVFLLGLGWPLTVILTVFQVFITVVGWDWNVAKGTTPFGFRKPTNPKARGFAVTIFGAEIQLFKVAK
jgi:hypothetical protein